MLRRKPSASPDTYITHPVDTPVQAEEASSQIKKLRITHSENNYCVSYEWDSYEDYLKDFEVLKKTKPRHIAFVNNFSATPAKNASWYGCAEGFEATLDHIENGWPELRQLLEEMTKSVALDLPVFPTLTTARKRKRGRDDQGDSLDMSRVWNGQLETAWERPMRTEKVVRNTKRVTLAVDISASAYVTNKQALWRAAIGLLLCDSLAKAGRVFEVWAFDSAGYPFAGANDPKLLHTAFCVKKTNDPLILDRLASMLSIGFLRTAYFCGIACGPYKVNAGLGSPLDSGLPATLLERQKNGETVLRIAGVHDKQGMLNAYTAAWKEVEEHAAANQNAA